MSTLSVTVNVYGDKEVVRKLKALGKVGIDSEEAMKRIGKNLIAYYSKVPFATKGRVYGQPWPALSRSYRLWKQRKYPGRGILQLSSGAQDSMQDSFFGKYSKSYVVIDNRKSYYKYHQSTAARTTKLPRRQMAGFNDPLKKMIKVIFEQEIDKQLKGVA